MSENTIKNRLSKCRGQAHDVETESHGAAIGQWFYGRYGPWVKGIEVVILRKGEALETLAYINSLEHKCAKWERISTKAVEHTHELLEEIDELRRKVNAELLAPPGG